ncbi:MAG: hypothetical protein AAFO75_04190 [Pseudomonadota bacterium]
MSAYPRHWVRCSVQYEVLQQDHHGQGGLAQSAFGSGEDRGPLDHNMTEHMRIRFRGVAAESPSQR